MKPLLHISLVLVFFPSVLQALPDEDIIFRNPGQLGIWMSDVKGRHPRRLFNPPLLIDEISIQEGDRYLLVVGEGINEASGVDVYLFDRKIRHLGGRNLTQGGFHQVIDAAISRNGDVVFTSLLDEAHPEGIYLIPQAEVHRPVPQAQKLSHRPASYVDWAPNGEEIVFTTGEGIFLLNIFSKQQKWIANASFRAVFSPTGKHLAFFTRTPPKIGKVTYEMRLMAVRPPQPLQRWEIKAGSIPRYITWSADGKYITYTLHNKRWEDGLSHFAVRVPGGKPEPIFRAFRGGLWAFEWTKKAYAVQPKRSLTTLWGQFKTQ